MHRDWTQNDLGQATMMMMLAATDLGIGTAHAAVTDQDQARKVLGLPDDKFLAYLLALGHPKDRALKPIVQPDRRPFDDVVHRGTLVVGSVSPAALSRAGPLARRRG